MISPTTRTGTSTDTRIVIPERFVIDESSYERLARLLAGAPSDVSAILAETGALPAGSSYRVHSEWKACETDARLAPAASTTVRGAVMLRRGVEYAVTSETVTVTSGDALVDHGSYVHDPLQPTGPLTPASERGRPPFPWRPVVVFLGLERDELRDDFARRLVNRLVRREIEARLATPGADLPGPHLTRPCAPVAESIRTLRPDVIITLDRSAADVADAWCTERTTTIVSYEPEGTAPIELVSGQIDRKPGRLRARFDRRVDPADLADVVHRLCAGPQPVPPTDRVEGVAAPRSGTGPRPRARPIVVVLGSEREPTARARGLIDNLSATSVSVELTTVAKLTAHAQAARLLLLIDVFEGDARLDELIDARRAAGLSTVVDLTPRHLDAESGLSPRARELAHACGRVTAPPGVVHRAVRETGVRALALPTLLTRARTADLLSPRTQRDGPVTIGWRLDTVTPSVSASVRAAGRAVRLVLDHRPDVHVAIVGDTARVPSELRGDKRVAVRASEPDREELGGWTVHLWTPAFVSGLLADDRYAVVEASCAGVPTVMPAGARTFVEGYTTPELLVADPDEADAWSSALLFVVDADPELRTLLARRTVGTSRSVYGSVAAKAIANRFYGWATYGEPA